MSNAIEQFTEIVNNERKGYYEENTHGIDPLTVIAIINIIYNIYKAIMIIYFAKNHNKIVEAIKNPNFLTRIIISREVRKECKEDSDIITKALITAIRKYGESEFKTLLSQIREKRHE